MTVVVTVSSYCDIHGGPVPIAFGCPLLIVEDIGGEQMAKKNAFGGSKHGRKSGAGTKSSPKPTKASYPLANASKK